MELVGVQMERNITDGDDLDLEKSMQWEKQRTRTKYWTSVSKACVENSKLAKKPKNPQKTKTELSEKKEVSSQVKVIG